MTVYDKYSRESIVNEYNEKCSFKDYKIIENDLSFINFNEVVIDNAEFDYSILDKSDFSKMKSNNLIIKNCDLKDTVFTGSAQINSEIVNSVMIRSVFNNARLYNLTIKNCIGHNMMFNNSHIINSIIEDCEMYRINLNKSIVIKSKFILIEKKDLGGFNKSDFSKSIFIDCVFNNSNLYDVNFARSSFINCDFTDALFNHDDLKNADLIHCKI